MAKDNEILFGNENSQCYKAGDVFDISDEFYKGKRIYTIQFSSYPATITTMEHRPDNNGETGASVSCKDIYRSNGETDVIVRAGSFFKTKYPLTKFVCDVDCLLQLGG